MPTVGLFNQEGKQVGDIQLNDNVFGVEVNTDAMHQVVVALLANKRQGTQSAKTRAEVRGGGIKPWRQKGTGRARQGSIRAPHYKGGGVVFAKKPRDFSYILPKKVRRLALKSALSDKVKNNELYVVDKLELKDGKTKEFVQIMKDTNSPAKTLVVSEIGNFKLERACRNLPKLNLVKPNTINTYSIKNSDRVIITKEALETVGKVYI